MAFIHLQYTITNQIAYLTLDRPDEHNALNPDLIQSLQAALTLAQRDEQVKGIVLKANGESFSTGIDLNYLQQSQKNSLEEKIADSQQLTDLYQQIYFHEKIIIAQVNGAAIAAGCSLAMICDFCYSVPEAKFGYTQVKTGFVPALASIFLLRKIGETRAKELLLHGELVSAQQATAIGLINGVIESDRIDAFVTNKAISLAASASVYSLKLTKKLLAAVRDMPLQEALSFTALLHAEAGSTD